MASTPCARPEDFAPPRCEQAEREFLGALMREPEIFHRYRSWVKPEHFYDRAHQIVYRTFVEMVNEGLPINEPFLIGQDLFKNGLLEEIGGVQFVEDLLDDTLHSANAPHHAQLIVKHAASRYIHRMTISHMRRVHDGADPVDLLREIKVAAESFDFGTAPQWPSMSSAELLEADFRCEWLVNQILVKGQHGVIGGLKKTLKTNIAIDLAISLGSRTAFLGKYVVPKKVKVWLISGESGGGTIQETAKRIARSRGITLDKASVHWTFKLPRLSRAKDVEEIRSFIKHHAIEVLILDPLYLCLGIGANQASDIYAMGEALAPIAEICQETGCTILFAHHFKKNSTNEKYSLPELSELAMSGVAEFVRQWLLLGRRSEYEPGTGRHELWMSVGGSAGHSKSLAVDIDEGQVDDSFQGRTWSVQVTDAVDTIRELKDRKKQAKAQKDQDRTAAEQANQDAVIRELEDFPEGRSKRQTRIAARLNPDALDAALLALTDRVESFEGKSGRQPATFLRLRQAEQAEQAEQNTKPVPLRKRTNQAEQAPPP